jgi:hypothetical protein
VKEKWVTKEGKIQQRERKKEKEEKNSNNFWLCVLQHPIPRKKENFHRSFPSLLCDEAEVICNEEGDHAVGVEEREMMNREQSVFGLLSRSTLDRTLPPGG